MYEASSDARNATAPATSSGRANTAQRDVFKGVLLEVVSQNSSHICLNETWCHRIASDVARSEFASDRFGQADQACFGRCIVRLPSLPYLAEDAGDVDNAAPTLFEHGTDDLLRAQVGRGQVGAEDRIPIGTLHAHDELIACDSGVVDEDIDFPKLGNDLFEGGLDLFFVAYVHYKGGSFSAGVLNFCRQFIELRLVSGDNNDGRSCQGKLRAMVRPIP